jgi:hypothetical protein
MKSINLLALGTILVVTATSCDSYKHSFRLSDVPASNFAVTSQVVDVIPDFSRKVKATSDKVSTSVADAKNNAYFNAIVDNEIDVIVDPIYEVRVRKGLFKSTAKATVHGYVGTYTNPRSTAEAKEEVFNDKIEAFKDFLALKEIVNEVKTTTIINSCCGGEGGKSGSTSHTIDSSPALIDQFNSLYNSSSPAVTVNSGGKDLAPTSTLGKTGLLSKLARKK